MHSTAHTPTRPPATPADVHDTVYAANSELAEAAEELREEVYGDDAHTG